MSASLTQTTLAEFLKLPYLEDSPAWEYVDGVALQKPMPKTRHSILQKRLLKEIDNNSDDYTALPELRCTFAGRSVLTLPSSPGVGFRSMKQESQRITS